jgi:hypothetical protein
VWLSDDLGTSLVAEAAFSTNVPETCKRYGVAERTLGRWRERVSESPELAALVDRKKIAIETEWQGNAVLTLNELLTTMRHLAILQRQKPFERGDLREAAGGAKILAEVLLTENVLPSGKQPRPHRQNPALNAHTPVGDRPAGGSPKPGPAGPAGAPADPKPVH